MRKQILTDRDYLAVTAPFMLSTMTQPLMGAVNTAVMGRLPEPEYIAAVALGAILFNNIYWFFGFLRVSTSGYAAQALGAGDRELAAVAFFRPLVLAVAVSGCCIILRNPILDVYLTMIAPAASVDALCREYYGILIWGAPLVLFNYVSLGWLMGQTRIRASIFMQVSSNVLNMALSVWFVMGMGFTVAGVAWATLLSQLYGAIVGGLLMRLYGNFVCDGGLWDKIFTLRSFWRMLAVNANLMLRTACLLTANNILAATGAALGTTVLAANAVLFQLKDIMSYLIDGMANGALIFSGMAMGRRDAELFQRTLRLTYRWLAVLIVLLIAGFAAFSDVLIGLFTDIAAVIELADVYKRYVMAYPLLAGCGLALYGFFTGTSRTAPIRNMMMAALAVFWLAQRYLVPLYGNDGLWLAFLLFVATQSVILRLYLRELVKLFTENSN